MTLNDGGLKPSWLERFTFGNIITVITILVAVVTAWARFDSSLQVANERISSNSAIIEKLQEERTSSAVALGKLSTKIDTLTEETRRLRDVLDKSR